MKRIILALGMTFTIALSLAMPVAAANVAITGGTNGPDCTSGGYFTPQSTTVQSGDTVTISVPANDPYAGGIEVHGFSEGNFVVLPGKSHTTSAITSNVSYYGTWPSTGCMKGSGTITVAGSHTVASTTMTHSTTNYSASPAPSISLKWWIIGSVVIVAVIAGIWWMMATKRKQ